MAEYDPQKVGYLLEVGEEYRNTLDMEGFSQMMQSPSYCYKFYWLEAIVKLISENKVEASYNEIIDEMIANFSEIKNQIINVMTVYIAVGLTRYMMLFRENLEFSDNGLLE